MSDPKRAAHLMWAHYDAVKGQQTMNDPVKFRPLHKLAVGRWRLNWRIGKYRWMWDWNSWGAGFCTPWVYVFVGRVADHEGET